MSCRIDTGSSNSIVQWQQLLRLSLLHGETLKTLNLVKSIAYTLCSWDPECPEMQALAYRSSAAHGWLKESFLMQLLSTKSIAIACARDEEGVFDRCGRHRLYFWFTMTSDDSVFRGLIGQQS